MVDLLLSKEGKKKMEYRKLAQLIPATSWEALSDKLVNLILKSKNEDKMPSKLANDILHHWQHDTIISESGITALLEAAFLLEPDKAIEALNELQLTSLSERLKEIATKI